VNPGLFILNQNKGTPQCHKTKKKEKKRPLETSIVSRKGGCGGWKEGVVEGREGEEGEGGGRGVEGGRGRGEWGGGGD